jgi:hypothetical protein
MGAHGEILFYADARPMRGNRLGRGEKHGLVLLSHMVWLQLEPTDS